jgi:hypothetical protein
MKVKRWFFTLLAGVAIVGVGAFLVAEPYSFVNIVGIIWIICGVILIVLGLGYQWDYPFTKDTWDDRLLIGTDIVMPIVPVDGVWHLNLGTEYLRWFDEQYAALRLGYRYPTDLGSLASLTVGGGLGTQMPGVDLSLDYAWVPYGDLGAMHRIAITAAFGAKPRPRPRGGKGGFYLYAPPNVRASASGNRTATIAWDAQTGRLDGYNLYINYNPANENGWKKLNTRGPLKGTAQAVPGLYEGYKVYFAVTTVALKPGETNLYQESMRSPSVAVEIPRSQGSVAPAAPLAPKAVAPVATPVATKAAAPVAPAAAKAAPAPPVIAPPTSNGPPTNSKLPPPPLPF